MSGSDRPVVVMITGDLHLTEPGLPNHVAALWAVDQANDLIRPDFVQFIGDNVQDATPAQFDLFADLAGRLRVPWSALVGDHDAQGDHTAAVFRTRVGPPTGSVSLGGFRFVRLNTQEARPVGLSSGQVAWLRTEVAAAALGERVVIFQHNYPYQIWEDFAGPGIDEWRAVVQTSRIHAILCGHTHYWQVANDGRNAVVVTRSIGDPEGGPAGYTLAVFHGDDFAVRFRGVDDDGPIVLVTHPREAILATGSAHVVRGPDEVRARVWSVTPVESVAFQLDGGAWRPMEPGGDELWRGPLPPDARTKGVHHLTVRATAGGAAGEHTIEFVADPTGRYTAVPGARPAVTATNFC